MPDNIPIDAPPPANYLEPDTPLYQSIFDPEIASEEFVYNIPHTWDMHPNLSTRHMGVRTDKQICQFMVYADGYGVAIAKSDSRFSFLSCPKWNTTTTTEIK